MGKKWGEEIILYQMLGTFGANRHLALSEELFQLSTWASGDKQNGCLDGGLVSSPQVCIDSVDRGQRLQ